MWWRLLSALPFFIAFKLKLMDNNRSKEQLFKMFFRGEGRSKFEQSIARFWEEHGTEVNPAIKDKLPELEARGAEFWVVSANFAPILAEFCRREPRFSFIATELEYRRERLTGKFASPNCYGQEKVKRIKSQLDPDRYSIIYAYGDSEGDRAMLQFADEGYLLQAGQWSEV